MPALVKILLLTTAAMSVAAGAAETITYTYDARGRVIAVARTGTVNNGVNRTYTIDKADNRTNKTTGNGGVPTNQPPVANPDSMTVAACGIATTNVVANDTDPDGNLPLTVVGVVPATQGTAAGRDQPVRQL